MPFVEASFMANLSKYTAYMFLSLTLVSGCDGGDVKSPDALVAFEDLQIENEVPDQINGILMELPTGDSSFLGQLVGSIAVRKKDDEAARWEFDTRARPEISSLLIKPIDESRFSGKVRAGGNLNARYGIGSGSYATDDVAEVRMRNVLVIGHKSPSDVRYDALSKFEVKDGYEAYFIPSIVVTEITRKRFQEHKGEGKIDGVAFGADGKVYVERGAEETHRLVWFLPVRPSDTKPGEAGGGALARLSRRARQGRITEAEASELLQLLNDEGMTSAPKIISVPDKLSLLPAALAGAEPIVTHDVTAIRQSSAQTCWAAASAMLSSWKRERPVSEQMLATSAGPYFADRQQNNLTLEADRKLEFLEAVGFGFHAPQSYLPEGIEQLLRDHGPVWFTIDLDEGRHASVVTGLFRQNDGEYWVSYIDPRSGTQEAERYGQFMNRYEAPAIRQIEDNPGELVETYADLDIQIVYAR